jgi:hypothetical protein
MSDPLHPEAGDLIRLAVELAPAGLLAVEASGTILLANREVERLFGYGREELVGQPVELLVPGRFRAGHPGLRAGFHEDPVARPMGAGRELFGLRKDGTEFPVEIGLNPIPVRGRLLIFASLVDVSQRQQLEEQLRQSQKLEAIGTIAGGIAHDFNNLLLSVVGHAELARANAGADARLREDLDQILKAAERGRDLVQRILTFSRQRQVSRVPLDLTRPLRDALRLLRASLPSTIEIRESLDPQTPPVLSDDTEVHQILMNLATNSGHAMKDGGRLDVRLTPFPIDEEFTRRHPEARPGLHARLTVEDDGEGMSLEVARRAFEPFYTTKPPGMGTGLGLSVIRGIVRGAGGIIELASTPGVGTRVDVFLPAVESGPLQAGESVVRVGGPQPGRILLVDDEDVLAALQRRRLEDSGYQVTMHTSSEAALADFRARPEAFDLLITDNTMPRLTGMALARAIHALRPKLPVLMISGVLETDDPEVLRSRGITAVLQKPHTAQQLEDAVRSALGPQG